MTFYSVEWSQPNCDTIQQPLRTIDESASAHFYSTSSRRRTALPRSTLRLVGHPRAGEETSLHFFIGRQLLGSRQRPRWQRVRRTWGCSTASWGITRHGEQQDKVPAWQRERRMRGREDQMQGRRKYSWVVLETDRRRRSFAPPASFTSLCAHRDDGHQVRLSWDQPAHVFG